MNKEFCFIKIVVLSICALYSSFSFSADDRPLLSDERYSHPMHSMRPPTGSYAPPQWGPDTRIPMDTPPTHSHVTHVGGNVHAADGGQVFLNPQITQILERSPNRFIYSQMTALPSVELTGAFEAADEQYKMTPQAVQLHLGTFKWIADAGHPLAKERYADLLMGHLRGQEGEVVASSRFGAAMAATARDSGVGLIHSALNSRRTALAYDDMATNYTLAQHYYKDALVCYRPDSIYYQQLKQKIRHSGTERQAIESKASSARSSCCCKAVSLGVLCVLPPIIMGILVVSGVL